MKTTTIRDYLRRDPEGESYRLVERTLEPPMLALSLLFIPVIFGPLLSELSPAAERGMELTGWAIWGAFVVEYLWLLYLAPERVNMVKTHKLDLLVVPSTLPKTPPDPTFSPAGVRSVRVRTSRRGVPSHRRKTRLPTVLHRRRIRRARRGRVCPGL